MPVIAVIPAAACVFEVPDVITVSFGVYKVKGGKGVILGQTR
jgi:hypothetical protein